MFGTKDRSDPGGADRFSSERHFQCEETVISHPYKYSDSS